MKHPATMRRTARFGSQYAAVMDRDQRIEARNARMANLAEIQRAAPPVARGVIERVIGPGAANAKPEAKRNAALLEMARGRECLLRVPGVCNNDVRTTVAAHSNFAEHGKSKSRKADDQYTIHACAACHSWLDTGHASREVKRAAFMAAHLHQVHEWRLIAQDPSEPERFRRAARWALEQLDSTLLDAMGAAQMAGL